MWNTLWRAVRTKTGVLICLPLIKCIDFVLQMPYNINKSECKGVFTMANTTTFSVRIDSEIKQECEELFGQLGMTLTTAINVFLRQSLHTGGLPFEVKMPRPNQETIAAMLEAERIIYDPNVKRYTDVEEALRELKK